MYTRIFDALNYRKMLNWLPDKTFLKAAFRARFGRKLNLNKPETFNEKMQLLCETNLEVIREIIERKKPDVAVIDSIQTMFHEDVSSAPGSVSQVDRKSVV